MASLKHLDDKAAMASLEDSDKILTLVKPANKKLVLMNNMESSIRNQATVRQTDRPRILSMISQTNKNIRSNMVRQMNKVRAKARIFIMVRQAIKDRVLIRVRQALKDRVLTRVRQASKARVLISITKTENNTDHTRIRHK